MTAGELTGRRILVAGATGLVAKPVAEALAADNEVWALARFREAGSTTAFEQRGISCCAVDLRDPDLSKVPSDVDYVLNFAVDMSGGDDFDQRLPVNAEAVGLLMAHCRKASAVLHCSSTAVYRSKGHEPLLESDPLGDSFGAVMPTYSITKIAAEAVVRAAARMLHIPATIARLNVPYGDNGGWPAAALGSILAGEPVVVGPGRPSTYTPIHTRDIVGSLPGLLAAAAVPATVVNWAGHEAVSIEDWATYIGELVDRPVEFVTYELGMPPVVADTTRLRELAGPTTVPWRDGIRAMVASLRPDLELPAPV